MPRPQQERVADALRRAKTGETVGGLDPGTQQMWDSFTDEERWRVLQLPKADRATEIQRYHAKKREAYRTNPFLSQLESERAGQDDPRARRVDELYGERQSPALTGVEAQIRQRQEEEGLRQEYSEQIKRAWESANPGETYAGAGAIPAGIEATIRQRQSDERKTHRRRIPMPSEEQ